MEGLLDSGLRALREIAQEGREDPGVFFKVFRTLCPSILEFCGADKCLCVFVDSEGRPLRVSGFSKSAGILSSPQRFLSHYLIKQVLRRKGIVFVSDARKDTRWRSVADRSVSFPAKSIAGFPLWKGKEIGGVFCLIGEREKLSLKGKEKLLQLLIQIFQLSSGELEDSAFAEETDEPDLLEKPFTWQGITTRSLRFRSCLEKASLVASKDLPILLVGEDGTGKETLARAIHTASGRKGPFVAAAVRAIPGTLIEAELFGYVPGAFTGAKKRRKGILAEADGGTLYLDDLLEMPVRLQTLLLRFLSEGVVRPLGSSQVVPLNVRIVCASCVDLDQLVREGVLREDLAHRLRGVEIEVPPLRKRPADILPLFEKFLREANPKRTPRLSEEAQKAILLYSWPGNIPELRNEAFRLGSLEVKEVEPENLSFFSEIRFSSESNRESERAAGSEEALRQAVAAFECDQIKRALAFTGGNKAQAARLLGITRRTLYRRLRRYGIGKV